MGWPGQEADIILLHPSRLHWEAPSLLAGGWRKVRAGGGGGGGGEGRGGGSGCGGGDKEEEEERRGGGKGGRLSRRFVRRLPSMPACIAKP